MRQLLSVLICLSLIVPTAGCASAGRVPVAQTPHPGSALDTASMSDYVQRLPTGSKVTVELADGTSLRGTLMKATGEAIVVQKNTRIPEPPVALPLTQLARVTPHNNGGTSTAKAIAIGIASGAATFLGIVAILAATFDD